MKREKKKRTGAPIKWKLLITFLGFAIGMLGLLWVFQVVFLERFYKAIKTMDIQSSAETIVRHVDDSDLQSLTENLAARNDLCVLILDGSGQEIASADTLPGCRIHNLRYQDLLRLYVLARENGGSYTEQVTEQAYQLLPAWGFHSAYTDQKDILVLVRVLSLSNGEERIVLLNSNISPVDATVRTLRVQLTIVTVVMVLLALTLALLLSRNLAQPIAKVNETAKELAKGKYDITFEGGGYREISELNDTLNYTAVELSKVEGLRRELLANISHDLRTPLTMITGYAEMMRDLPGENTPENVQVIIDEASRLTRLVNDLLDLSNLQAGAQKLSPADFCLTRMVRDTIGRINQMTGVSGYHVSFQAEEEAWVHADEMKISQVLYNLLGNAINYTGEDRSVMVTQQTEDGWVQIQVTDTGEGIPEDKLLYVWDRYYKLDKTHKRAAVGTGLGLSIVKNVLELHNARFGVTSEVGKGSTFWFALPVSEKPNDPETLPSEIEST